MLHCEPAGNVSFANRGISDVVAQRNGIPVRRAVAASRHWFFIALALGRFLAASVELSLGRGGSWVLSAASATTGIVVAIAVLGQASHNLIGRLGLADAADVRIALRRERLRRALHRLSDAFLWILGGAWLAETWGLDLVNPAPGSPAQLFVRPIFEAAARRLTANPAPSSLRYRGNADTPLDDASKLCAARYARSAHDGRTRVAFRIPSAIGGARNHDGSAASAEAAMDERSFRATAREPLRQQLWWRAAAAERH
jgi:hypothetical protein